MPLRSKARKLLAPVHENVRQSTVLGAAEMTPRIALPELRLRVPIVDLLFKMVFLNAVCALEFPVWPMIATPLLPLLMLP